MNLGGSTSDEVQPFYLSLRARQLAGEAIYLFVTCESWRFNLSGGSTSIEVQPFYNFFVCHSCLPASGGRRRESKEINFGMETSLLDSLFQGNDNEGKREDIGKGAGITNMRGSTFWEVQPFIIEEK
jgi:hypothetical protein